MVCEQCHPPSPRVVPGRTTQGNDTRGCEERRCSAGTFPRGRWARTCRQGGWLDPSPETSLRFGYCWGKARRCHAPSVWATIAEHQHPVSKEPRGAVNPDVDSALSVRRYPTPEIHPHEGLPSPARRKAHQGQSILGQSTLQVKPSGPPGLSFRSFPMQRCRLLPAPGAFTNWHRRPRLREMSRSWHRCRNPPKTKPS